MRYKGYKLVIFLFILIGFFVNQFNEQRIAYSYSNNCYPTNGWPRATPEELGMNSTDLRKINKTIVENDINVDSVHVVRYGYLSYERYFEFYDTSDLHDTKSVAKSIMSILVGIANASGLITDLDEPIADIFSERTIQNMDTRKQAITIRHLLMMQSGLEWNEFDVPYGPTNDFNLMKNSSDWIQYVLDKPMVADPGTEWYYNSGGVHLLSAIIENKTGMIPEDFAEDELFTPLNITEYHWIRDPMGLSFGAGNLWLHPLDMMKLGYLYLQEGQWLGVELVPNTWIDLSTQNHSPGGEEYGYLWWIDSTNNHYRAEGAWEQYIIIQPKNDLVAVFTANESTVNVITFFNTNIQNSIFADPSVTCPTVTTTTTPTTIHTSTTTTATILKTTPITTSGAPGFTMIIILSVMIGGSLFERRRRRK